MSVQIKARQRHGESSIEKNGDWEENSSVPVVASIDSFTLFCAAYADGFLSNLTSLTVIVRRRLFKANYLPDHDVASVKRRASRLRWHEIPCASCLSVWRARRLPE